MTSLLKKIAFIGMAAVSVGFGMSSYAQTTSTMDEKSVIESYNRTGFNLFRNETAIKGNIFLSPYSIGTAMSMTYAGAKGATRTEMAKALNLNATGDNINLANSTIARKLSASSKKGGGSLEIANGLCLTKHPELVSATFRKLMQTSFNAELFNGTSVAPINAWVSKKTNGKIPSLLTNLSANSVCVLLNAVSFKGVWVAPFDKSRTSPQGFGVNPNESVSVPTMQMKARIPYIKEEGLSAVSLSYNGGNQSLTILLPEKQDGLASLEKRLTFEKLQSLIHTLTIERSQSVALSMPKFKIMGEQNLIPAFQTFGMQLAFSQNSDFGGITGHANQPGELWIAQIKHKAIIEVDETGSVAAAATAVEMQTKSASMSVPFHADHPFLFCITDKATGAILFMGRMANPLESKSKVAR